MGDVPITIRDGGAGIRYAIPSQTRPATHSVAAISLNRCQRVIPNKDVFRYSKGEKTPKEGYLHIIPLFIERTALVSIVAVQMRLVKGPRNVHFGS